MAFRLTPYLLRLLPSPDGDRVAMTVACRDPDRGVSVLVQSPGADASSGPVEVTAFDTLLPAAMAWDATGQTLACAQGDSCRILDARGLTQRTIPGTASSLGFDERGRLWLLSDQSVFWGAPDAGFQMQRRWAGVLALSVARDAVAVRRREGAVELVVAAPEGERVLPWPLACDTKARLAFTVDGQAVLVSAEAEEGGGLVRFELARVDLSTGQASSVQRLGLYTDVGAPPIPWSAWRATDAVVLCARGAEKRLWQVDLSTGATAPLSPPGFDVSEFAVSRRSEAIAMLATSATGADASRQNILLLCRPAPDSSPASAGGRSSDVAPEAQILHRGASRVPVWAARRERLFHSDGSEGADPVVCIHDAGDDFCASVAPSTGVHVESERSTPRTFITLSQKDGVETVSLERRAAASDGLWARSAIVYAQGPNRRLVDGRQPVFFHEVLLSLLDGFARRGCRVLAVGKNGTLGAGPSSLAKCSETSGDPGTSEPAWLDAMRAALESSFERLYESGVERIAVVAGSLGALPLLHAVAGRALAGAVVVAPVYSRRLPVLRGSQYLFGSAKDKTPAELGAQMQTPLLVMHGVSDELTPVAHSSSFVARVPEHVACDYLTFPEEPHIFRRPDTWSRALGKAHDFLDGCLSHRLGKALAG